MNLQAVEERWGVQDEAAREAAVQALKRKARSEHILVSEGVSISHELPPLEVGRFIPRQRDEIAYRTLCLLMTAIKSERMDQGMVLRVVRQYGLAAHFSPSEKEFIRNVEPSEEQRSRFSWKYESAWVLLWALGYVESLGIPRSGCDVAFALACMRERNTENFKANARLRPAGQILDQADLVFRYHWSLIDSALAQRATPAGLDAGIVYERHYALNWLIRHNDEDWDEVTTQTGSCV